MTTISFTAASSREAARRSTGQFGHQAHAEADLDLDLTFDAPEETTGAGAPDLLDKRYGPDAPELRAACEAHDTEMAKLMGEKGEKCYRRDRTLVELRHHIGESQQYYRGRSSWTLDSEEMLERAKAKVEAKDFRWQDTRAALGRYDCYVAQARAWAEANPGRVLTQPEVEGAAKLVAGGYDGPREVMAAYKEAFFPLATEADAKSQIAKPLVVFGDVVAAGATPEKVKAMTRAGIPPVKIAEHVNDPDYWSAGAAYRERHAKQMAQEREWEMHDKPSEWPIAEEQYRTGA